MKLSLALCLTLVACGNGGDGAGDDAPLTDASTDGTPSDMGSGCVTPDPEAPWLRAYLEETMTALTSAPRYTNSQRETARVYLEEQLDELGWTSERQPFQVQNGPSGENVFVTIPATVASPGKEIIIGAHFDTVMGSPGASDNASGSSVVLALARYLGGVTCRSSPVTLVFFDLEEAGLYGAYAFAQRRDPDDVLGVGTIDMVSWDGDGDRHFEIEAPTPVPTLEEAWRSAATDLDIVVTTEATESTDHQAFRQLGFQAIGLTEEYRNGDSTPHYHMPSDTIATVVWPYLELAAQLVFVSTTKQFEQD